MKNTVTFLFVCVLLCIYIEYSIEYGLGHSNQDSGEYLRKKRFVVLNPNDAPSCTAAYCRQVGDGLHQPGLFPCSRYFCTCASGRAHEQQCGAGLVFNRQHKNCDYQDNVLACKFRVG